MLDVLEAYDEHVWDVYAFLAYRVSNRADAEDLTQQTFERAVRSAHRFDPERASVRTWLLAIARNLLIDHSRLASTTREIPTEEIVPRGWSDGPEHRLGVSAELEAALRELSSREREIVALRFGGDLTGPEIAEMLGLSLSNVQQILSRSLRRMRGLLDAAAAGNEAS
jgi:RNA polymerase sigma-70 factor (ECF subfamily)